MSVRYARPDASEMMFHVFRRSLHPELFAIHAETRIVRDRFTAWIRICDTGHWISFAAKGETICELMASRGQMLPQRRRFLQKRLRGSRDEFIQFDNGIGYHVCYQLEQLDPEVFLNVHDELLGDFRRATLAHQFPCANRLAPCPVSLIRTDVWERSLLVHTYHTFPENCAIAKTQSLFEIA